MRAFFGADSNIGLMESVIQVDPNRSPFMNERIEILCESYSIDGLMNRVKELPRLNVTFKVLFVKNPSTHNPMFKERRSLEREVGLKVDGTVDLHKPGQLFGIMNVEGRWLFGRLKQSEPVWLKHEKKPYHYSTALSTRIARSIVNIAVPNPTEIKAIDPCCGIGTVLIEASSMGVYIEGSDSNPKVMYGLRKNLAHFGIQTKVSLTDMRTITGNYDVAIIDMPYNLCSVITDEEKLEMFTSARTYAKKVVIVTIESFDHLIRNAGFMIVDRCIVSKNKIFSREILVCE
ncbi:RNA methyltransferase [Salipaludibacillus keqinensis]|uniref:RNA methyltransferase n=2 Tax=Salipaludibacillus keqinensis TaxID=2045207 RepID=A0A323T9M8_9BACI|nr:RNA methyltransferase [Salipaludibacillus keqinensis]